jgi:hypothetical protein
LVNDVLETVHASLRSLASGKGIDFVVSAPADLPVAYGDGKRIVQCLVNLAGNAIKFTRGGMRGDRRRATWRHTLVYRVTDTGIGIPQDQIENIFSEFRQVDATHQPRIWRHRPRAQHHQEVCRPAWGPHLGGEHTGQGIDVLVRGPTAAPDGRVA